MRISDWSSDVCSSDLKRPVFGRISEKEPLGARSCAADRRPDPDREHRDSELYRRPCPPKAVASGYRPGEGKGARMARAAIQHRSEEHTSELQSLMRISYAVFCLKKKKEVKTDELKITDTTIE